MKPKTSKSKRPHTGSPDEYANKIMKNVVGVLCQAMGWHAAQTSSVDILADLMKRHLLQVAKTTHEYAEHYGRTVPNLDDANQAFRDLGISIPEMDEYVQSFDPVTLPYAKKVPQFPLKRETILNFLRPGSEEVLTRPVHVHEYMPPMIFESRMAVQDKDKDVKATNSAAVIEAEAAATAEATKVNMNGDVPEKEIQITQIEVKERTPERQISSNNSSNGVPVGDNKINVVKVEKDGDDSSEDEIEALASNSKSPGSGNFTPFSGLTPKSKRDMDENPALKRVRMMLEEEGHPLREITSAMMTTSGFLTSSREGRLPETRPPPNREFFEPLPPPVVEKKKKVLTMKRIVEGVKKIDKEKENNVDKNQEEPALFGNPDKIYGKVPSSSAVSSASAATASSTTDLVIEKSDKKLIDKGKDSSKKLKKLKKLKLDKETMKKLTKGLERDKKKLKIFKKTQSKSLLDKTLKKNKKLKLKEMTMNMKPLPPLKKFKLASAVAKEEGLDNIDSDEDFGLDHASLPPLIPAPPKPKKIRDKGLGLELFGQKIKKPKDKSMSISPTVIPVPKGSPLEKLVIPGPAGLTISPDGQLKKKRGRPRKNPLAGVPLTQSALKGLGRGLMEERPLKIKKSHMEPAMRSLIPDISINTKPHHRSIPPPSNFDMLMGLPTTPGLIPTNYLVPPPSLTKLSSHVPPSISITPATPSTPSPLKEPKNQFAGLPANVCSSVTITPIDMSSSQKLPTPYDKTITPGIGSPLLNSGSASISKSSGNKIPKGRSSPAVAAVSTVAATIQQPHPTIKSDSSSGITITPIVMDKGGERFGAGKEKMEKEPANNSNNVSAPKAEKGQSMLAKLEEDLMSKEQRKKEKERRKELKKEKKKEKKDKVKDKDRDKERGDRDKSDKKEKRDKSEKKKKKDKSLEPPPLLAVIPKMTIKLGGHSSSTPTPVDSPNPPQVLIGGLDYDSPPPTTTKKIVIKPIEEQRKRTPSPELARFSPLVTRAPKPARAAKTHAAAAVAADAMGATISQQMVSFPPVQVAGSIGKKRGRPSKVMEKPEKLEKPEKVEKVEKAERVEKPGKPSKSSQGGLVTETVGCIIDDQGNKIWICPKCGRQDDGSPMIGCDLCDDWYHFTCVGIVDTPEEDSQWYCPRCRKKNKKEKKK